jgi:hypothetical protein
LAVAVKLITAALNNELTDVVPPQYAVNLSITDSKNKN